MDDIRDQLFPKTVRDRLAEKGLPQPFAEDPDAWRRSRRGTIWHWVVFIVIVIVVAFLMCAYIAGGEA